MVSQIGRIIVIAALPVAMVLSALGRSTSASLAIAAAVFVVMQGVGITTAYLGRRSLS